MPPQTQAAVKRAVGVCKQVTGAISHSFKRRHDLSKAQVDLGLPTHQLQSETPTRWGSQQQMISRFIEQEKALAQDDESPLTRTIKEGILNYLNDKYDDNTTEKLLDMATPLDP